MRNSKYKMPYVQYNNIQRGRKRTAVSMHDKKLCIEIHWEVVGGLSIGTNLNAPNPHLTPKFGDLKTPSSNYGQTVADGATL